MGMFLVQFKLSNKGEWYEDERVFVNLESLDLEEVFHILEEDMSIPFQIEDFVRENYGELVFDSWRPVMIQQWVLDEQGLVERDIEPKVVWSEDEGGVKLH